VQRVKYSVVSTNSPLVSVIIPAYNAEASIRQTIQSIISQVYQAIEILVVDDGSEDQTSAIVRELAQNDVRLRLFSQPNLGVAAARNAAIAHARGEFIAPIDADDIWHPHNLAMQVKCLLASSFRVGLTYGWSLDINTMGDCTGGFRAARIEGNVYKTLLCHNFIGNASATLIRRSCFETVGGYNTEFRLQKAQGCEDWDLYLRIAEQYEFRFIPEFLIGYRKLNCCMSNNYSVMARSHALMLQSVQDKHPEISVALHQLSKSSFYVYLAYQSNQGQQYRATLYWLYRALRADWITPWFRLGVYRLLVSSILWGVIQPDWTRSLSNSLQQPALHQSHAQRSEPFSQDLYPGHLEFKLLIGNLLHQTLMLI
jgi:glycosyltransferase involved in cell wall biosynthesis